MLFRRLKTQLESFKSQEAKSDSKNGNVSVSLLHLIYWISTHGKQTLPNIFLYKPLLFIFKAKNDCVTYELYYKPEHAKFNQLSKVIW